MWPETLNKPRACIAPVPKNLSFTSGRISIFRKEKFSRHLGMRRNCIIQRETNRGRENSEEKKRREQADEADARGQHRDNFVRARHPAEHKKQGQQEGDWQENDQNLRDLGSVIFQHPAQTNVSVKEGRNAVADIEDEPDRYEPDDAVQVSLQEISGDISIK